MTKIINDPKKPIAVSPSEDIQFGIFGTK